MKLLLASVDRLLGDRAAVVRSILGPEAIAIVDEATGVEWLPLSVNVALSHALGAALDEEEFARFHRAHCVEAMRGPIYRAIVDGAVAIYGESNLGGWLRFLPIAWAATFRDCGRWITRTQEEGRAELLLQRLPGGTLRNRTWATSVAACLDALLDTAHVEGGVTLIGFDPAGAQAAYELRWSRPALASGTGTG